MDFINSYGMVVKVHGKNMCVSVDGTGEQVLAIFPCSGSPSPILEMKALVYFLSKKYTVVTIEGFGSGQSDMPIAKRTYKNIAEEIHETLQKLGFTQYSVLYNISMDLCYSYYIRKYSDEITSLILMDMYPQKKFLKQNTNKTDVSKTRHCLRNTEISRRLTRISAKISLKKAKDYIYSKNDIYMYELLSALNLSRDILTTDELIFKNAENISDIDILMLISEKTDEWRKKRKIPTIEKFAECKLKKVIFSGNGKVHLKHPKVASIEIEKFLASLKS